MKGHKSVKIIVKKFRLLHTSLNQETQFASDPISIRIVKKATNLKEGANQNVTTSKNIVNVSRPIPINRTQKNNKVDAHIHNSSFTNTNTATSPTSSLNDIGSYIKELKVSSDKTADKLEDVLKLVSETKTSNTKIIEDLKQRIKQVEYEKKKDAEELLGLQQERKSIQIKVGELESFLKGVQDAKKLEDEEHFREFKAYESSLTKSRSLNQRNFFNPIDPRLIRNVRRGNYPLHLEDKPNALFPIIPSSDNRIHEFMILNKGKTIVTKENPLNRNYHKPDLLTLMKSLGTSSDDYWKIILKHEKQLWNLIAIEGYDSEKILIFERFVTPQELKNLEKQKYLRYCYALSTFGLICAGISHYFYLVGSAATVATAATTVL